MIVHELSTIFLHIGKTAGVAVERMLCQRGFDHRQADRQAMYGWDDKERIFLQHATAATLVRIHGRDLLERYYVFTVVRNPFARLVSVYYYLYETHRKRYGTFEDFIGHLPDILTSETVSRGTHYTPQAWYVTVEDKNICDYTAHFENLPESLEPVRQRLGITSMLHQQNTYRHPARGDLFVAQYYTPKSRQIVRDLYRADFYQFGYSLDPEVQSPL